MSFMLDGMVTEHEKTFIIAEIGQNHQGDIEIAKQLIAEAKKCGADCVKFQKSCLTEKFTLSALKRPYTSVNSWGDTYGQHKAYLEFSIDDYLELQTYAKSMNLLFTASAMDAISLEQLYALDVPFIKIGSGDGNNFPMIEKVARHTTPLVISTGMQKESTVRKVVDILSENNKHNYCLMHCVSSYPTKAEHVNLRLLGVYREWFPGVCLGYSGHEQGIWISAAAVLLGAKVIERHFTLDKRQKGTDHLLSLEPAEFRHLTTAIRSIDKKIKLNPSLDRSDESILKALAEIPGFPASSRPTIVQALKPIATKKILNCERECFNKLGKSLVFCQQLNIGTIIAQQHICAKVSEPRGIPADRFYEFLGLELAKMVDVDELVNDVCFRKAN